MNFEKMGYLLDNLSTKGAFFTTTNGETINTMTISWGFIGFAWRKPVFIGMVRPQRFTSEILKKADCFTISVPFDDSFKDALSICGSKSGRDIDKTDEANIKFCEGKTVLSPVIENCGGFIECQIIHKEKLVVEDMPSELIELFYKSSDYHEFVFGEIKDFY